MLLLKIFHFHLFNQKNFNIFVQFDINKFFFHLFLINIFLRVAVEFESCTLIENNFSNRFE